MVDSKPKKLTRRAFLAGLGGLAAAGAGGVYFISKRGRRRRTSRRAHEPTADKVIILGIDGLDPNICERMMDAGELPNFDRLRRQGDFRRLQTVMPPQSPVAWASLASGCNPGKHGIFDFVKRHPANYSLHSTLFRINQSVLRRRDTMFLPSRKGPSFWAAASECDVPVNVIRWPTTFPPEKINGRMLSGLGVPDISGSGGNGLHAVFEMSEEDARDRSASPVTYGAVLTGPLRSGLKGKTKSHVPLLITPFPPRVVVQVGEGKPFSLRVGKWSPWIPVEFPTGALSKADAMACFYVVRAEPRFKLYVTARVIDPLNPAFPISYPRGYSAELAKKIGRYHTLGMPEDHNAVDEGILSLEDFLGQCEQITVEREKMFEYELSQFEEGILAFVFDTSDRIQHMTWFARDAQHPAYTEAAAKRFGHVIPEHYKRMDSALGKALAKADDNTLLMVVSDHGFAPARRKVELSTWLHRNGYLGRRGGDKEWKPNYENVDWTRTKAYPVGINGIFLNLKGREGEGIVEQTDAENILANIRRGLLDLKDPKSGGRVFRSVYAAHKIYHGPHVEDRPELIVGLESGYRPSWHTALGAIPSGEVIVDNSEFWSGDHMIDASLVPASLFANRKLKSVEPTLLDIAPTVLSSLGLEPPPEMDGRIIL